MDTTLSTTLVITPQNEQQRLALVQGQAFLNGTLDHASPIFRMNGYAGSGKSTLSFALAGDQLQQSKRVAFCAPTHKALNVLRKIARSHGLTGINFFTIHQLLGLSLVKRGSEKVLEPLGINYVGNYDAVWLDECSMVGAALWSFTQRSFTAVSRARLMLMGDPAQLYPVGEGRSPTFDKTIPGVTLTDVVRQAAGNPLMDFITRARKAVTRKAAHYRPFTPRFLSPELVEHGAMRTTSKALLRYACSKVEAFDADPDGFRILAWRNQTVDRYNTHIRTYRYGKQAPRFVVGERLITRDPVYAPDGKTVLIQTSTEFVITGIKAARCGHYQAWQLTVEVEGTGQIKQIYALHEDEQARFDAESQRLLELAQRNPYLWRNYYQHLEVYANIRPCYALTVHNSQGSTFTECAIDGKDLAGRLYPRDDESDLKATREHNRLWYVGVSRAQNRVHVVS